MTLETCTAMIIHLDFKPDSPLQSLSSSQTGSDSSVTLSEDPVYVVQPLNAAQCEYTLHSSLESLINKSSVLELVLEPILQYAPKPIMDISNMDISDSDEEDEHFNYVDQPELNKSSSSSTQLILTFLQHLQINLILFFIQILNLKPQMSHPLLPFY